MGAEEEQDLEDEEAESRRQQVLHTPNCIQFTIVHVRAQQVLLTHKSALTTTLVGRSGGGFE